MACLNETINRDGLPTIFLSEELTGNLEVTRAHNRNYCLAEGFTSNSKTWTFFLRYQAQSERLYRRALEDFERLKALRSELPSGLENDLQIEPENESIAPPQPQETKPAASSETKSPQAPAERRPAASASSPTSTPNAKIADPRPIPGRRTTTSLLTT
jgi:hypothetical protein